MSEKPGAQMTDEEWRSVVGYEGAYEVSNLGRVRSLPRLDARGWRLKGRTLRASKGRYATVSPCMNGMPRPREVHRLVLEAFEGPCPPGLIALHADDDGQNNALSNLRWGTPSENSRDIVKNGNHRGAAQAVCGRGHPLTGANLVLGGKRPHHRRCRACTRGGKWARSRGIAFTQELAVRYYADVRAHERTHQ